MTPDDEDAYAILGVPPDASTEEIKAARRALAKQCHPDITGGDDERLKRVNRAWDLIGTSAARAAYDAARAAASAPEPEMAMEPEPEDSLGTPGWGERVVDPPWRPPPPPPPPPTRWQPPPAPYREQQPPPHPSPWGYAPTVRYAYGRKDALARGAFAAAVGGLCFVVSGVVAVALAVSALRDPGGLSPPARSRAVTALVLGGIESSLLVVLLLVKLAGD